MKRPRLFGSSQRIIWKSLVYSIIDKFVEWNGFWKDFVVAEIFFILFRRFAI